MNICTDLRGLLFFTKQGNGNSIKIKSVNLLLVIQLNVNLIIFSKEVVAKEESIERHRGKFLNQYLFKKLYKSEFLWHRSRRSS